MFLHLIKSDPKFPPLIRKLFEAAMPGEHVYALICDRGEASEPREGFHVVRAPEELRVLLRNVDRLDGVILNGVLGKAYPYLELFPEDIPMAWVVWGVELYEHLNESGASFHGPLTRQFFGRTPVERLKSVVRPYYWILRGRSRQTGDVLQRLSYVVTQLPAEFELVASCHPRAGLRHVQIPVVLLGDLVDKESDRQHAAGKNIQVGNSAHSSNNHLEAFEMLQGADLADRKVLVPLSYGDPEYRKFILTEGKKMLGDAFEPITDFLPLTDYLALMQSCSSVMMNQYRQQGLGNIIAALWRGAAVYLAPSATYMTYSEWGLSVFDLARSFPFSAPSLEEVDANAVKNRRILEERIGRRVVLSRTGAWLDDLKVSRKYADAQE